MVQLPIFPQPPVDIHCHFNHGSTLDIAENPLSCTDIRFLQESYRHMGIAWGGISTFASVYHPNGEGVAESNRWLFDFTQREDWVRQWVVVDPRIPESFQQAKTMLESPKTLGIKIHPVFHQYDLAQYGDEIFSFANDLDAVVLMHPVMTPEGMEQVSHFADKYPNMTLILAHLCSEEHVDVIQNAKNGNVYTDTSGSASYLNNVLEYAVDRIGSEKILFGSDNYSLEFQFGRVALSRISFADKENILYKNARNLFPKAF
jgi:predicted TIM-barrel fold metal-dependent hydrolase